MDTCVGIEYKVTWHRKVEMFRNFPKHTVWSTWIDQQYLPERNIEGSILDIIPGADDMVANPILVCCRTWISKWNQGCHHFLLFTLNVEMHAFCLHYIIFHNIVNTAKHWQYDQDCRVLPNLMSVIVCSVNWTDQFNRSGYAASVSDRQTQVNNIITSLWKSMHTC